MITNININKTNSIKNEFILDKTQDECESFTQKNLPKNLNENEITALYNLSRSDDISDLNEDDTNALIQYFQKYIPELCDKMNIESLSLLINKKAIKMNKIPSEMQTDEIISLCCQYDKKALKNLPEIKKTKKACEHACMLTSASLEYTPKKIINSEFLLKIHSFHSSDLRYIPKDLIDKRIINSICLNESKFIKYVGKYGFKREVIVSNIFKNNIDLICHIPVELKTKERCEMACQSDGRFLKYIPEEKKHFELCLIACLSKPDAIEYIPSDMPKEKKHALYEILCKEHSRGLKSIPYAERTFSLCKIARKAFPYDMEIGEMIPKNLSLDESAELDSLFKNTPVKKWKWPIFNPSDYISSYDYIVNYGFTNTIKEKLTIPDIINQHSLVTFIPKDMQYKLLTCSQTSTEEKDKLIEFINCCEKTLPEIKKEIITNSNPSAFDTNNDLLYDLVSIAHMHNFQPPNIINGRSFLNKIEQKNYTFQNKSILDYIEEKNCSIQGGRTLRVESKDNKNELIHIKFQRENESLDELIREGAIYQAIHQDIILKGEFHSGIPKFVEFSRIKLDDEQLKCLSEFEDPLLFEKTSNGRFINALIYKATNEYAKYAHIINDDIKIPERGILKACSDIGLLASMGIVLDSIIPTFHSQASGRRWVAFFSAFNTKRGYVYPGNMEAWNTVATEKCDIGYTGIRDIGDHEIFGKIKTCMSQIDTMESPFPEIVNQRIGFVNTITESLLSAILIRSRLHQQTKEYHYKNPKSIDDTEKFINSLGNAFCNSFNKDSSSTSFQDLLEMKSNEYNKWLNRTALEIVYWTAKQPSFDELCRSDTSGIDSDCLLAHIKNNHMLPLEIYPYPETLESPFNGFDKEKNLCLGIYNGTFPLLSLMRGLTLMSIKLLSK